MNRIYRMEATDEDRLAQMKAGKLTGQTGWPKHLATEMRKDHKITNFPFATFTHHCGYSPASLRGENSSHGISEKNGTSPKTWYWVVFKIGKLEVVLLQVDLLQNQRKRRRKFLQFLENFSGGISPPSDGNIFIWNRRGGESRPGRAPTPGGLPAALGISMRLLCEPHRIGLTNGVKSATLPRSKRISISAMAATPQ